MAIRFTAQTGNAITRSDPPASAFTWMAWIQLLSDENTWAILANFQSGGHAQLGTESDGVTLVLQDDSNASTGQALSLNTWYHVVWVHRSNADNELWINGVRVADSFAQAAPSGSLCVGAYAPGDFNYTATWAVADMKMWSAALSDGEVVQEMRTKRPLRTANLYSWLPTFAGVTERVKDYSGNGRDWSVTGTLTDEDNPPIPWGSIPLAVGNPSAGGTTYDKTGGATTVERAGGQDTLTRVETGGSTLIERAGGTDSIIRPEIGGAIQTARAGGSDTLTHSETGGASAVSSGGGADVVTHVEPGGAITVECAGGQDTTTRAETGGTQLVAIGGGADTVIAVETGGAASPLSGGGSDVSQYTEHGGAVQAASGGGSCEVIRDLVKVGGATSAFSAGGSDALTRIETGGASAALSASGAVSVIRPEAGGATLGASGGGVVSLSTIITKAGGARSALQAGGVDAMVYAESGGGTETLRGGGITGEMVLVAVALSLRGRSFTLHAGRRDFVLTARKPGSGSKAGQS